MILANFSSGAEQDGPVKRSTRIDVEAPVEQVWKVLREVERWPGWAPTVTSVRRLDDGALAVGSRVRVEQPRIPATVSVVTELVPGRSSTWVATGPGVRTTACHVLEELGPGGTRVTLAVEQAGPLGAVMGWYCRPSSGRPGGGEARCARLCGLVAASCALRELAPDCLREGARVPQIHVHSVRLKIINGGSSGSC